eukprot:s548_g29.t1
MHPYSHDGQFVPQWIEISDMTFRHKMSFVSNAATSLLQVKRVHDASKATAAAAASTAPPSSAGESEPSAGSPPEPTPEEVAQTAAAVEKALDEALPLFLQTAWAAVVTDIDSTVKEIGRKLLKEFVRDLAGSMEAYRDSTKLQMPELQDKSVPWQLRVRRSQALQRLGDIFEEESRGIAPPAIASFAALGFFSGGSEGPGGRRLLEDHDFGGRQGHPAGGTHGLGEAAAMNRAEDAQKLSFVLSFRRRGLPELSAHGWLPRMQPVFRNELQKLLREDFGFLRSLLQSLAKQLIEPSQDVYAAYAGRDFAAATECYSEALESTQDAVVLSNRSATYAQRRRFDKALLDADKALKLCPGWSRLYHRRGHALFHLGRYNEAMAALEEGLKLDGQDKVLLEAIAKMKEYTAPGDDFWVPEQPEPKAVVKEQPKEAPVKEAAKEATPLQKRKRQPKAHEHGTQILDAEHSFTTAVPLSLCELNHPLASAKQRRPHDGARHVPPGGVKVLPRWAEEDEVCRWRLRYRPHTKAITEDPTGDFDEGAAWVELELRNFTRELPLANLDFGLVHDFKVAIQTPEGWSDWSVAAQCEAPPPQPPGKLAALLPRVLDVSSVKVRWTPPLDCATVAPGLRIQRYMILVTWAPRAGEDGAECSREISVQIWNLLKP